METNTESLHAGYIFLFIWFCFVFMGSLNHLERVNKFKFLLKDKYIILNIFIIFLFSVIILGFYSKEVPPDNNVILATKHALIALVIAICATIDLPIAPFYFVWIVSYYFNL